MLSVTSSSHFIIGVGDGFLVVRATLNGQLGLVACRNMDAAQSIALRTPGSTILEVQNEYLLRVCKQLFDLAVPFLFIYEMRGIEAYCPAYCVNQVAPTNGIRWATPTWKSFVTLTAQTRFFLIVFRDVLNLTEISVSEMV